MVSVPSDSSLYTNGLTIIRSIVDIAEWIIENSWPMGDGHAPRSTKTQSVQA
jgi:hypothetical protein